MSGPLKFIKGMKYQLAEDHRFATPVTGNFIHDAFFTLWSNGVLDVRAGYAWDGASGPTIDTKSSMKPSLPHDVFCAMMRDGRLDYVEWQDVVNEYFYNQCLEAGMWKWRAGLWHAAVEFADAGNPDQGPDRPILEAP